MLKVKLLNVQYIYLEEYACIFLQNRTALILKCFTSFVDCIFFIIKIAPFEQPTHHNILHNLYKKNYYSSEDVEKLIQKGWGVLVTDFKCQIYRKFIFIETKRWVIKWQSKEIETFKRWCWKWWWGSQWELKWWWGWYLRWWCCWV